MNFRKEYLPVFRNMLYLIPETPFTPRLIQSQYPFKNFIGLSYLPELDS
jgi:hypothetical protein